MARGRGGESGLGRGGWRLEAGSQRLEAGGRDRLAVVADGGEVEGAGAIGGHEKLAVIADEGKLAGDGRGARAGTGRTADVGPDGDVGVAASRGERPRKAGDDGIREELGGLRGGRDGALWRHDTSVRSNCCSCLANCWGGRKVEAGGRRSEVGGRRSEGARRRVTIGGCGRKEEEDCVLSEPEKMALVVRGRALVRLIVAGKVLLGYHFNPMSVSGLAWQSKPPRRSYASSAARVDPPIAAQIKVAS